MCVDPVTLTIISTLAGMAGTAVTAVGQSNAQKAMAQQDENNAIIAKRNANDARERGNVAEQDQQLRTRAAIGKQTNILSERMFDLGNSSALDLIGDTAMFGKMDALTIRGNFEREAIAHETQSMNFNASADQNRNAARMTMFGAGASLFTTALGGVSDYRKAKAMSL